MLKIDIIKFEAQDVITTSVANGNLANQCKCITVANGACSDAGEFGHVIGYVNGQTIYCEATEHTCNRNY